MADLDFSYFDDQKKALSLLKGKQKVCLMAAPSFVVDFDYLFFVPLMKGLGFDKVSELTFGAKIVNEHYHKFIKDKKGKGGTGHEKFISSVCPASVEMVKNQHPELKKFLLPFDSPMVAMAKVLHKEYPKHKLVFLAPCSAKKIEAKKSGLIDVAITFREMKEIVEKEKPKRAHGSHLFDRFYNDYTKIYPLSGGLSTTLHMKDILKKHEVVACDGCADLAKLFDRHSDKIFYDILFCKGGCIGGNGVASKLPLFLRKKKVLDYKKFADREKIPEKRVGLNKYTEGLSFETKF
jgi:iron only hydrogenase large subunit-like protein